MTTPKLKLHSFFDERPVSTQNHLLTFVQREGKPLVSTGIKLAADDYIQAVAQHDSDRYYVSTDEIADFLTTHNLIRLPFTQEQLVYRDAFEAWLRVPESLDVSTPYYQTLREAFIKFHVEQVPGRSFSKDRYATYCG